MEHTTLAIPTQTWVLLLYLLITVGNFLRWDRSSTQRSLAKGWERFVQGFDIRVHHHLGFRGSGWSGPDRGRCCSDFLGDGNLFDHVLHYFVHR